MCSYCGNADDFYGKVEKSFAVEEKKLSWERRFCISTTRYNISPNIHKLEAFLSYVPMCRSTEHSETKFFVGDSQLSENRSKKKIYPT